MIEILDKTQFEDNMTLKEHYNLDEKMAAKVAEHLFDVTSGVPRRLRDAFVRDAKHMRSCWSTREDTNSINISKFTAISRGSGRKFQKMLRDAEMQEPVDLSVRIEYDERSLAREIIANNALIAWEGTLQKATLLPNQKVVQFFGSYFTVFREYIELL
jgi:hypothetical protein